jgi:acetoin utilization protein AcuB
MLPVMQKNRLAGVISERDFKKASSLTADMSEGYDIKVKNVMTGKPVTVFFDYTVEETAELILLHRISGVPVVNYEMELVGIITLYDLCKVIFSLTGFAKGGVQFGIQTLDKSGSIKSITDLIRNYGCQVSSILTSYERVPKGYMKIFIRVSDIDSPCLNRLMEEIKQQATLLYIINHVEKRRIVY